MRISTTLSAATLLFAIFAKAPAFAVSPIRTPDDLADVEARKAAVIRPVPREPIYRGIAGDTIGSAIVIPSVPFQDSRNTCDYMHDYDEVCPFNVPGGRDVVYRFTPAIAYPMRIQIDLCSSLYDTKVYVYQDGAGDPIACNDDACGTGLPGPWQSRLEVVELLPGHDYYIVVDGYSPQDCGVYSLVVAEVTCCDIVCPPGSLLEGEPLCHDGYRDEYNSGCSGDPIVFSELPCSDPGTTTVICGEYGGFLFGGLSYRDTDWYQIVLDEPRTITWCVTGEYSTLTGIIDGREGCAGAIGFYDYTYGSAGTELCLTDTLGAGTWWLWVGTLGFGSDTGPCGSDYVAELTGYECGPIAVRATGWGRLKGSYR